MIYVSDETPYNVIDYDESGNVLSWEFMTGQWEDSDFWRPHEEDFEKVIGADTKCLYLSETPVMNDMWRKIFELKDAFGFKVMWEPNGIHSNKNFCKEILEKSALRTGDSAGWKKGDVHDLGGEDMLCTFGAGSGGM